MKGQKNRTYEKRGKKTKVLRPISYFTSLHFDLTQVIKPKTKIMKKIRLYRGNLPMVYKMLKKMKLTVFLILITFLVSFASESYSQSTRLTVDVKNTTIKDILGQIEDQSEFRFFYSDKVDVERVITLSQKDKKIFDILDELFNDTGVTYEVRGRQIALSKENEINNFNFQATQQQQPSSISGIVKDVSGQPLPGVTVVIKGTAQGTITDIDGQYTLPNVPGDATLIFSFVGMKSQEIAVNEQSSIDVSLEEETIGLDEVVAIGYGSVKKSDLTGSVSSVKMDAIQDMTITSIDQGLGRQNFRS